MRYAFLVQFCDPRSDVFLLASRCHQVLHGFQCHNNLRAIGVAYPRWNLRTLGDSIAFICHDKGLLQQFSQQPLFPQMKKINKFAWGDIALIQEGGPEVQYFRTQKPDKYTQAWLEKDSRRREKRGVESRKYIPQIQLLEHYHSVKKRNGYLHIHRSFANQVTQGQFSSYGLSGEMNSGTVPLL
ncbi:type I-F CRISPR-associated endoribonuclease Cas6/Csy4 [Endozoicomonas gorgoniicola]|uniref:Type I-F CRISPR-associated endoribonuclease Cas6/Csy4 n=1 Tax=Endozoicomonas gorgoniicola TaxID=1234144 RepID=A0ABT3N2T3_9GAMM|nr:type I-F CRISPR-associated endoribonuclease Cas6/Csy4 [Endozoicomonas gorgoniicola]MCW7555933.1 type I-F CRISPR-associated endoribonuclease Cas6/Csy4 [Endozoicomonas gorgoniicola]